MPDREKRVRDREREAERYREAAERTLQQLEWSVNYLHRIGRTTLATGVERNRAHIQAQLETIASGRE
jgi:hypothetical protein